MKSPVLLLITLSFALIAEAQTASLKVRGEASVKTVPELMEVNIPLEVKESSYTGTSDALTATYSNLEKSLTQAGIPEKEIQTFGFNIRENYRYENRERIQDGYVGSMNITVEIPYTEENMASVMNTLKMEEFNFGYNLNFTLSEEQKKALLEQVIKEAIADGKLKARLLSESLEVRLISLDEINFGFSESVPDVFQPKMRMAEASSDAGVLDLNPREMEIRKEVGLVWKVAK